MGNIRRYDRELTNTEFLNKIESIGRVITVALAKEECAKIMIAVCDGKQGNETIQLVKAAGSEIFFVKTDVQSKTM
jgi:hypothetical protein